MGRFQYVARDSTGKSLSGEVTAGSQSEAVRLLRTDGKFVVTLQELADRIDAANIGASVGRRRVARNDVIDFATQLGVMVDTGVSLTDAISGTMEQTPPGAFRDVLEDLLNQLESGQEFSTALSRHPKAFNSLFVNLVRAAEASGTLGAMLRRCAEHLSNDRDTRRRVRGAMLYPMIVFVICVGVTIFLMTYVLPKFTAIYAGREAALPWPTVVLISVSDWLCAWWKVSVPLTLGTLGGSWFYLRSQRGRPAAHWLLMRTPILGKMYHKTLLTRCLRTMGTLVDAGVSMLDSVAITRGVMNNCQFERMWDRVTDRLHRGEQLSVPLGTDPLMPRPIVQMVRAGERSGRIGEVMNQVGEFLEEDLRVSIRQATKMLEPAMMVVMGAIVGGIAIALLLPIFTISRVMTH